MEKKDRYFIFERDDVSKFGDEDGSTREDAEKMLNEYDGSDGDLVVIKGVKVRIKSTKRIFLDN